MKVVSSPFPLERAPRLDGSTVVAAEASAARSSRAATRSLLRSARCSWALEEASRILATSPEMEKPQITMPATTMPTSTTMPMVWPTRVRSTQARAPPQ